MTLNPLTIVRNAFRNAALLGIGDALNELAPADGHTPLTLADMPQLRFAIANGPTGHDEDPFEAAAAEAAQASNDIVTKGKARKK